jgi:hypothetical protein
MREARRNQICQRKILVAQCPISLRRQKVPPRKVCEACSMERARGGEAEQEASDERKEHRQAKREAKTRSRELKQKLKLQEASSSLGDDQTK